MTEINFVYVDSEGNEPVFNRSDRIHSPLDATPEECSELIASINVSESKPALYTTIESMGDYAPDEAKDRHGLEFLYNGVEDGYPTYRNDEFGLIVQVREEL